jgi:crossover junction endodeoxyribonuclease RuvC
MNVLGIDCGLSGAIAIIRDDGTAAVHDTPAGGGEYQIASMVALLQRIVQHEVGIPSTVHCYLEQAQAFPGQGVSSSFKTGMGYGIWQGLLTALDIPWSKANPTVWKKVMGIQAPKATPTERKHIAVARAQQLFPQLAGSLLVSKDGRAEALLIARYGLEHRSGS